MMEYAPLLDSPFITRIFRSIHKNTSHFLFLFARKKWIIILVTIACMVGAFFFTRNSKASTTRTINYNLSYLNVNDSPHPDKLKEWTIFIREMINHLAPTGQRVGQSTAGYVYSFQIVFSSNSIPVLDSFVKAQIPIIESRAKLMLPANIQLNKLSDRFEPPARKRLLIIGLSGFAGFLEAVFVIMFLDVLGLSYRGLKKTKEPFLGIISRYHTEKIENLTALMHALNYKIDSQKTRAVLFVGGDSMEFVDTLGTMYAAYTNVVVINFDLYRDNLTNLPGLSEYLYGKCSTEDIIQKTENGYYSIGNGQAPEQNSYLLILREWEKIRLLMNELQKFSVILIKTPQLEHSPIVLKLLELEPLTVMVAEPTTNNRFFMQLHKELKENKAKIAGFVINKVSSGEVSPDFWD